MAERVGAWSPPPGGGYELDHTDRHVDAIHARLLATITAPRWPHGVRSATSLALVARFYERFGDQAVSVADAAGVRYNCKVAQRLILEVHYSGDVVIDSASMTARSFRRLRDLPRAGLNSSSFTNSSSFSNKHH
jgi:phosphate uptake regulator